VLLPAVRNHRRLRLVNVHDHEHHHFAINIVERLRHVHIDDDDSLHDDIHDYRIDRIDELYGHQYEHAKLDEPINLHVHEYEHKNEHLHIGQHFFIVQHWLLHRTSQRGNCDRAGDE
jgi:hypothetical protein